MRVEPDHVENHYGVEQGFKDIKHFDTQYLNSDEVIIIIYMCTLSPKLRYFDSILLIHCSAFSASKTM